MYAARRRQKSVQWKIQFGKLRIRQPFQLFDNALRQLPQDGFHRAVHAHIGNKMVGELKKNAVHDFSVFQHFSPFSVQDSGTVPILFAKIIAVRQPHPPPLLWFPPLPPSPDEPPKLRLNAVMSFRQLFFSGKHVFPVQIHLSTSYSSNKGVLL